MNPSARIRVRAPAAGLMWAFGGHTVHAQCSRAIVVPLMAQGRLVMTHFPEPRGVLPDLLRRVTERAGCHFTFEPMPRARAEKQFFEQHTGDVYMVAARSAARDAENPFASIGRHPMAALSLRGHDAPNRLATILDKTGMRAVFVRGVWLGEAYRSAVQSLLHQGRADIVSDFGTLARMLKAGRAEFTLLPYLPSVGALDEPATLEPSDFQSVMLVDLPALELGVYTSRRNLPPADIDRIHSHIKEARRDGSLRELYRRYYREDVVVTVEL